jgi:hypothetical protein
LIEPDYERDLGQATDCVEDVSAVSKTVSMEKVNSAVVREFRMIFCLNTAE